jgi:redox-sensitive bicupin YhaK (pirin superfamily)
METLHLLQIWILPDQEGLTPRYDQKTFTVEDKQGKLRLIAAKDGRHRGVTIDQDVDLYTSILEKSDVITYHVQPRRYAWLQIATGEAPLNGQELIAGDGVQIIGEEKLG